MASDIAATILEQMGGAGRIHAMTGATIMVGRDSVSFKLKRGAKVNYFEVEYDYGSDTYSVQYGNVRGTSYKPKETLSFVYPDQLKRIFEQATGLYLSL